MYCGIARNLAADQIDAIKGLERTVGLTVVAFSCRAMDPLREERLRALEAQMGPVLLRPPARTSQQQLDEIRRLEGQLGLALVAVQPEDNRPPEPD